MRNIYLVGFMATGKTSVGIVLSKTLLKEFLDMDDLIQKQEKMPIVDIFAKKGEAHFRKIEKEMVKEISTKEDMIVSCGGGVVMDTDNLSTLKNSGTVICLKASVDTILERSKGTKQRPLLNVEDSKVRIMELLNKRDPFYNQAHHTIDTTDLSIDDIVNRIKNIIKEDCRNE